MAQLSKIVRKHLTNNQSIADCVRRGLINYSALARSICAEYHIKDKDFDAVLMACRRTAKRLPQKLENDRAILQLVKKAKVTLETKMVVVIIEKPRHMERLFAFHTEVKREQGDLLILEGEDAITLIFSENWLSEVRALFKGKILRVREHLVLVNMAFSQKIEKTSGVIAYVYRIFAEHGINILEEVSCWTSIMFMIEEKDLKTVSEALRMPHGHSRLLDVETDL